VWKQIGLALWLGTVMAGCGPATHVEANGAANQTADIADPKTANPLADAAKWLWNRQAADGGWHSEHYAFLRSGEAMTPMVLAALLEVPDTLYHPPPGPVEKGLDFIREHVNATGVIGLSDPEMPAYPNYASAYALSCLVRAGDSADTPLIEKMASYLASEQFRTANGFPPEHLAHGGWGFGGFRPEGSTGHMDIAHTRRVLDALRLTGHADEHLFRRVEIFLRLLQRRPDERRPQPAKQIPAELIDKPAAYDGGFYFSPIVHDANKGREVTLAG